jgi:DNA repair protein REV1
LKKALEACPHLIILPYEFEKYQEVSEQIYSIFFSYTHRVEALSCDEALLEFFFEEDLDCDTVEKDLNLVNEIRMEIFKQTRCTASVGLSHNILLARIATAKAKPNGSFFFRQDNSFQALSDLSVDEIPGVGWHTCQVMEEMKILKCSDLQKLSFSELEKSFGEKKARALYQYSRGIDDRELNLTVERKSIGVDVGWGVRFENEKEVEQFLIELSKELSKKLIAANRSAISLTFKIKERAEGAPEPKKYLGHGICNNRSKSVKLPSPLINHQDIFNVIHALYKEMRLDPIMIRALGITASKLEHNQGSEKEPHIMNYFSKQNQVQNESSKSIQPLSNMRIENRQSANQPKRRNSILSFFKSEKHQPSSQENSTLSVASFANPQLFIEQFSSAVDPSILKELPFFVRQQLRIDKAYLKLVCRFNLVFAVFNIL